MSEIKGYIPIRPHLLRYVQWRELLEADEPIIIPGYSPIAQALDLCITNKTTYLSSVKRRQESHLLEYTTRLYYLVRGSRLAHNYIFVPPHVGMAYNVFLHHAFHDDLLHRIQAMQPEGEYEIGVIQAFLDEIGIADMIDYASVKRAQTRLRKAKGFVMAKGRPVRGTVFCATRPAIGC